MFCVSCGKDLSDGVFFCRYCGNRVPEYLRMSGNSEEPGESITDSSDSPQEKPDKKKKSEKVKKAKKSKKRSFAVAGIAVGVAALGVAAVLFIWNLRSDSGVIHKLAFQRGNDIFLITDVSENELKEYKVVALKESTGDDIVGFDDSGEHMYYISGVDESGKLIDLSEINIKGIDDEEYKPEANQKHIDSGIMLEDKMNRPGFKILDNNKYIYMKNSGELYVNFGGKPVFIDKDVYGFICDGYDVAYVKQLGGDRFKLCSFSADESIFSQNSVLSVKEADRAEKVLMISDKGILFQYSNRISLFNTAGKTELIAENAEVYDDENAGSDQRVWFGELKDSDIKYADLINIDSEKKKFTLYTDPLGCLDRYSWGLPNISSEYEFTDSVYADFLSTYTGDAFYSFFYEDLDSYYFYDQTKNKWYSYYQDLEDMDDLTYSIEQYEDIYEYNNEYDEFEKKLENTYVPMIELYYYDGETSEKVSDRAFLVTVEKGVASYYHLDKGLFKDKIDLSKIGDFSLELSPQMFQGVSKSSIIADVGDKYLSDHGSAEISKKNGASFASSDSGSVTGGAVEGSVDEPNETVILKDGRLLKLDEDQTETTLAIFVDSYKEFIGAVPETTEGNPDDKDAGSVEQSKKSGSGKPIVKHEVAAPDQTVQSTPTPEPETEQDSLSSSESETDDKKKTKQQKAYVLYAKAIEDGTINLKDEEYVSGPNGLIDFNGDGLDELVMDGSVWCVKNGKVKKMFKLPEFKGKFWAGSGVWWSYYPKKKLLYNYNTSGWNGGHVWKLTGKTTRYLFSVIENHDEARSMYLLKNRVKKKINRKTYNKYEKKLTGKSVAFNKDLPSKTNFIITLKLIGGENPLE